MKWKKPTISVYRERVDKPEHEPFVVIKAQEISVESKEEEGYKGVITDFFALMGDIDYISSEEGKKDRYVLCWFDDGIGDFYQASRKMNGVAFSADLSYVTCEGKRTYHTSFHAKHGKLSS